ncbi:hypothetical protein BTO04_00390 [Polaribacter sp. SA4-10]|nr:hypothetical protein BTO04_00390 [Polaribacter sp. SA4-10]
MDQLYSGIIDFLKLEDVNMDAYDLAQSGFLMNVNLLNDQKPIVNQEIFDIGNSLPEDNLSYIPNGDLITSYSLFLNNLIPTDLPSDVKESYQKAVLEKVASEKAFIELKNISSDKSIFKKPGSSSSRSNDFKVQNQNLVQNIEQWENAVYNVLKNYKPIVKRSAFSSLAQSIQLPTLSEAMSEVSFITGARNIEHLNSYNMKVNSDPPKKDCTYSAKFGANVPAGLYDEWIYNANNNIFPCVIKASSEEPMYINYDTSESSQSFRRKTKGERITMETYQIEAKFSGLDKADLYPIEWFHPEFFLQNGYELISSSPKYFGVDGILENIPTSIILAYNVQIKIEFTKGGFDTFNDALAKTKKKEGFELSLGSIGIFPQGKQQNFNITPVPKTNTIVLDTQQLKTPNLVGVYSRKVSNYIENSGNGWNCISS